MQNNKTGLAVDKKCNDNSLYEKESPTISALLDLARFSTYHGVWQLWVSVM